MPFCRRPYRPQHSKKPKLQLFRKSLLSSLTFWPLLTYLRKYQTFESDKMPKLQQSLNNIDPMVLIKCRNYTKLQEKGRNDTGISSDWRSAHWMNWASSWDYSTYHIGDQRRLGRAVSPESSLFAKGPTKIRHLVPLDSCASAFEEWVYGGWKVP